MPQTTEHLESHNEAARILKMLYCLAKDVWENEPSILDRYSFEELLNEIIKNIADINHLLTSLIRIVKNLNRQELYAPLIKDIVMELIPIYYRNDAVNSTQTQFIAFNDLEQRKSKKRNLHQTMMINFE